MKLFQLKICGQKMPSGYNSHLLYCLCVTVTDFMCCDLWSDTAQLHKIVQRCSMVATPVLPAQPGFCPQGRREQIQGLVERNTSEPILKQSHSGWNSFFTTWERLTVSCRVTWTWSVSIMCSLTDNSATETDKNTCNTVGHQTVVICTCFPAISLALPTTTRTEWTHSDGPQWHWEGSVQVLQIIWSLFHSQFTNSDYHVERHFH
jgi:hypothetical protein